MASRRSNEEGDGDLLIFAAMRSAWFDGHPESEVETWSSSADTGWRAAEQAARPAVGAETHAGLPKRVPQANLVPGSPLRDERPLRIIRDAASIAAHTTGYFRGWRRGQEIGGYALGGRPGRESAGGWDFTRDHGDPTRAVTTSTGRPGRDRVVTLGSLDRIDPNSTFRDMGRGVDAGCRPGSIPAWHLATGVAGLGRAAPDGEPTIRTQMTRRGVLVAAAGTLFTAACGSDDSNCPGPTTRGSEELIIGASLELTGPGVGVRRAPGAGSADHRRHAQREGVPVGNLRRRIR